MDGVLEDICDRLGVSQVFLAAALVQLEDLSSPSGKYTTTRGYSGMYFGISKRGLIDYHRITLTDMNLITN